MTGSSITATVLSVVATLIASRSLYGTCAKPAGSGWNGSEYLGWPPAVTVASVLPWNEPDVVMISNAPPRLRAPHLRATLIAASLASAPELQKNTRDGKESWTSRRARSTWGRVKYRLDVWMRICAWAATAEATAGWAWPRRLTAIPATRSRYSRPDSSYTRQPLPRTKVTGNRRPVCMRYLSACSGMELIPPPPHRWIARADLP